MVCELSKGSLYPLQGGADEKVCTAMIHLILCISDMVMYQSSNSTDSCQNVDGCTSDVRKQDQHSACSNESESSDSEHIDISSSSIRSESEAQPMMYRTRLNHNF